MSGPRVCAPSPPGGGEKSLSRDGVVNCAHKPLLSVDSVSLSFGGVKALTEVSFGIDGGEIRAIIGPNGAGKTSMLNVVNGFYHPDHGAITFKGRTRAKMQP
ncbi:MAG TPA: ATP-binding cassette domain-containing protein, partial [Xanthobacteraceae bacterium]|nr:ATP-binding cassette domain-containing protein [Xanthobacteraceae bacterium]